ncbi:MAG: hypothetical protein ACON4N_09250 [Myxococcota bacterium]
MLDGFETTEAERRAGRALWSRVADAGFIPTSVERQLMAVVPVDATAVIEAFAKFHAVEDAAHLVWDEGWEALGAACAVDELDRAMRSVALPAGTSAMLQWHLARRGLSHAEDVFMSAARWVASRSPTPDTDAWWVCVNAQLRTPAFWEAVGAHLLGGGGPLTDAHRVWPAVELASPRDQAVLMMRLATGGHTRALEHLVGLGEVAWMPLLAMADAVVSGRNEATSAVALCSGLWRLSVALGHQIDDALMVPLLRLALDQNVHDDAVGDLVEVLGTIDRPSAEALLIEAPLLRWRYIAGVPSPRVLAWALGELRDMTRARHEAIVTSTPDATLHVGRTLEEFYGLAAGCLGACGREALGPLTEILGRGSRSMQCVAAQALSFLKAPASLGPLVQALMSADEDLEAAIHQALIPLGDAVLGAIEPLLWSGDRAVRLPAARALMCLPVTPAVRSLAHRRLMDEGHQDIRAMLRRVGESPLEPDAEASLRDAILSLSPSRVAWVEESLNRTRGHGWTEHRALGVELLILMARWAGHNLGDASHDEVVLHSLVAASLSLRHEPHAAWAVARVCDVPGFKARYLEPLRAVFGHELAAPLVWRLNCGHPASCELLKVLPSIHAEPFAADIARLASATLDESLRRAAVSALAQSGVGGVDGLIELLDDDRTVVDAARGLERIGARRAGPALRAVLGRGVTAVARWELHRALAVCDPTSTVGDDRKLDGVLASMVAGEPPGFVDLDGLPRLTWKTGEPMSSGARAWWLRTMESIARGADWLMPLWVPARFLVALRDRLAVLSRTVLLEELERQALSSGDQSFGPFLTVARALLWTRADVEQAARSIEQHMGQRPELVRGRLTFPHVDPRTMILHGSRESLYWVVRWSEGCGDPMVMCWAQDALERLADEMGCTRATIEQAIQEGMPTTRGRVRRQLHRWMQSQHEVSYATFLSHLDERSWREEAACWVFEALDAMGEVSARFRLKDNEPVDLDDTPVLVGEVRVALMDGWDDDAVAAWQHVFGDAFNGLQRSRDVAGVGGAGDSRRETGWVASDAMMRRLCQARFAIRQRSANIRGGARLFPPAPPLVATRRLSNGWSLSLELTDLTMWTAEEVNPGQMRVKSSYALRDDPATGHAVRVATMPSWVRASLDTDVQRIGQGGVAHATVDEVISSRSLVPPKPPQREEVSFEEPREEHELATERRRRNRARPAPVRTGFWGWLFGGARRARIAREKEKQARREARKEKLLAMRARRKAEETRQREEQALHLREAREADRQRSAREADAEEKLTVARQVMASRTHAIARQARQQVMIDAVEEAAHCPWRSWREQEARVRLKSLLDPGFSPFIAETERQWPGALSTPAVALDPKVSSFMAQAPEQPMEPIAQGAQALPAMDGQANAETWGVEPEREGSEHERETTDTGDANMERSGDVPPTDDVTKSAGLWERRAAASRRRAERHQRVNFARQQALMSLAELRERVELNREAALQSVLSDGALRVPAPPVPWRSHMEVKPSGHDAPPADAEGTAEVRRDAEESTREWGVSIPIPAELAALLAEEHHPQGPDDDDPPELVEAEDRR